MSKLSKLMSAEQKKAYDSGKIELSITPSGRIAAREDGRVGYGRSPRQAIEAMK